MAQALHLTNFFELKRSRQDQESNRRQWSGVKSLQSPSWLKEIYDRISALETLEENCETGLRRPACSRWGRPRRFGSCCQNWTLRTCPRLTSRPFRTGASDSIRRVGIRDLEIEVDPNGEVYYLDTIVGGEPVPGDVRTLGDAEMPWTGCLDVIDGGLECIRRTAMPKTYRTTISPSAHNSSEPYSAATGRHTIVTGFAFRERNDECSMYVAKEVTHEKVLSCGYPTQEIVEVQASDVRRLGYIIVREPDNCDDSYVFAKAKPINPEARYRRTAKPSQKL